MAYRGTQEHSTRTVDSNAETQETAARDAPPGSSTAANTGPPSSGSRLRPYTAQESTPAIRTRPGTLRVVNGSPELSTQASTAAFAREVRHQRAEREHYENGSPRAGFAMRRRQRPVEPTLNSASSEAGSYPSLVDSQADLARMSGTPGFNNSPGPRLRPVKKSVCLADEPMASRTWSNTAQSQRSQRAATAVTKRSAARVPLSSSSGSRKRQSQGTPSPSTQRLNLTASEMVTECEIRSILLPVIERLTSKIPMTPDSNLEITRMAQEVLGFARSKKACKAGIGRCCFYVGYTLYDSRDATEKQDAMPWFERALDASINGYPEGEWARQFINRWESLNLSPASDARPGNSRTGSWIADRVVGIWNYFSHGASPRSEQRHMGYHIHGQSSPRRGARSQSSLASESPQSAIHDHHGLAWSGSHPFGHMELVQSPEKMYAQQEYDKDEDDQVRPTHILGGLVDAAVLSPTGPPPMPNILEQDDDDEERNIPNNAHSGLVKASQLDPEREVHRPPPQQARKGRVAVHRQPRKPAYWDSVIFDKSVVPPTWKGPQPVKESHRHHADPFVEDSSTVRDTRPTDTQPFNMLRPAAEIPEEEGSVFRHNDRLFASGTSSFIDRRYSSIDPRYSLSRQAPSTRTSSARSGAHLPSPYDPRYARSTSVVAMPPASDMTDDVTELESPRRRRMKSLNTIATGFSSIGALGHRRQSNSLTQAEEGDSPYRPNSREEGLYLRKPSDAREDV